MNAAPKSFPLHQRGNTDGFARVEAIVVAFVVACLLAGLLILPALSSAKKKYSRANCVNNLKQVGAAFRLWAGDNSGLLPMQAPTNAGGAKEMVVEGDVCRVFQIMSNELMTPKLLVCPQEGRQPAMSFAMLARTNISYFVGLDAKEGNESDLLGGDANLTVDGKETHGGLTILPRQRMLGWTPARHQGFGNLLFADGSVQQWSPRRLTSWVGTNTSGALRLAVP